MCAHSISASRSVEAEASTLYISPLVKSVRSWQMCIWRWVKADVRSNIGFMLEWNLQRLHHISPSTSTQIWWALKELPIRRMLTVHLIFLSANICCETIICDLKMCYSWYLCAEILKMNVFFKIKNFFWLHSASTFPLGNSQKLAPRCCGSS